MDTTRRHTWLIAVAVCCSAVATASLRAAGENDPSPERERELIEILLSDAPKADKALACKHLAVHASSEAVPVLAELLADEELASWARIPLEAIPDPSADEALRNALDSLEGELLVGVINSLGVRRDPQSVATLTDQLQNQDAAVASAAAAALGHVGGTAASDALEGALVGASAEVSSAIAEGLVLCAERSLAEGDASRAVAIYDEVRGADVPLQRKLEATRGAILARGDDGIPLLLEQFQSPEKPLFQIALSTFREFPGSQVDKVLATEFAKMSPPRAALTVQAMADRKDTLVLAAVLTAAQDGPQQVRVAAIEALGRAGDGSCLAPLLEIAQEADAELVQPAKASLAVLPGEGVDQDILARVESAQGKAYPLLLELVGERRIAAVDTLVEALDHSDGAVRSAALTSLGQTVTPDDLSVLMTQVLSPRHQEDAEVAQRALRTASVRMPDPDACAAQLTDAMQRAAVPTQCVLLEILGEVGGAKSLDTVAAAARSNEDQLRDVSSRVLGRWMTIDAAPVLLELAQSGPDDKYRIRALRGYLRIARQFNMSRGEHVAMCREALQAASQPAERQLILDILRRYPNVEALKLAIQVGQQTPELKSAASQATLAIAHKLGNRPAVGKTLSQADLDKVQLEIVKAEYGAGETQKDVTATLREQAGDTQWVALPSPSYNTAFGGDPVPDSEKRLTIEYRINGKAGEASFAENELIILPLPQ